MVPGLFANMTNYLLPNNIILYIFSNIVSELRLEPKEIKQCQVRAVRGPLQ
jgi:hypothetical protein